MSSEGERTTEQDRAAQDAAQSRPVGAEGDAPSAGDDEIVPARPGGGAAPGSGQATHPAGHGG